jgi:hypothetical protein
LLVATAITTLNGAKTITFLFRPFATPYRKVCNLPQCWRQCVLILSLAFGLSACGGSAGYKSATAVKAKAPVSSYATALKIAKAEQKKAKKVGMEWNTIRKLMKSAKKKFKEYGNILDCYIHLFVA